MRNDLIAFSRLLDLIVNIVPRAKRSVLLNLSCLLLLGLPATQAQEADKKTSLDTIIAHELEFPGHVNYPRAVKYLEALEPSRRVLELSTLRLVLIPSTQALEINNRLFQELTDRAESASNYLLLGDILAAKYGKEAAYGHLLPLEHAGETAHSVGTRNYYYAQQEKQLKLASDYYVRANDLIGAAVVLWDLAWFAFDRNDYKSAIQTMDEAILLYKEGCKHPKRDPNLGISLSVRLFYHGVLARMENERQGFVDSAKANQNPKEPAKNPSRN